MRIKHLLSAGLLLALLGQGCVGAPATEPESPSVTEEAMMPSEGSPSTEGTEAMEKAEEAPAPTPTPKPAPKPAPTSGTSVKPKTVVVEIKDGAFSPQILAVNAGDTVVWKNVGKSNHTTQGVRNGPLVWDSGNLAPGQSYSRVFSAAGRFGYGCAIHPNMTGEVVVGEAKASGQ